MKIAQDEAEILFLYAFRYAIGRKTYASLDVSILIINHLKCISLNTLQLIKKETAQALEKNLAGDDCDRERWEKMLQSIDKALKA